MFVATEEQIKQWKAEHGDVIRLKSAKYNKSAYFRKPNRKEMSFINMNKDGLKFNEALLKACYLAGDKDIQENDDIFMGLGESILGLLAFDTVEVEKL
jgi:hypothetical protein